MAFTVSWIFTAKNKYSKEAKKIAADTAKINKEAKGAAGALIRKGTALRNLKAAAITARRKLKAYRQETNLTTRASSQLITQLKTFAVVAVAGLGLFKLIDEGAKFQESMAGLSAITGSAGKDLSKLKGEIKELSLESRLLPSEVTLAFTQVASAKSELLKTEGALAKVTQQSLLLANAAGISIPDAVRASVGALNQFNAGADQASRFVNVIAAGAKVGSSLVGQTAEALKNAGAVAKSFNLTFEETNALIQVLAKNEIKGAEAGTALRGSLLKLETQGGGRFKPSVLGIVGALEKLRAANLDNTQMAKLFGAENLTAGLILRSNIPLIKQWTKELTGTNVAQEQATIKMSTFNSEVEGMKVRLSLLASGIFDKTLPAIGFLTGGVNKFLSSLNASDIEAFSILLTGLAAVAGTVGVVFAGAFKLILFVVKPVLAVLKGIATVVGQVIAAFATLDFSQFDLSGAFDLGGSFLGLGSEAETASAASSVPPSVSPAVSSASASATVNGEIVVRDSGGNVESVSSDGSFQGAQGNIGLGLAQ